MEEYCRSVARLIANIGRSKKIRRNISTTIKGSFSEFPRISKGLNPVGEGGRAKRLASVSPFQDFILLERGQNLCLHSFNNDNDRYNLGKIFVGSERHLPAVKPLTFFFGSREGKRDFDGFSLFSKCISSCILNYVSVI